MAHLNETVDDLLEDLGVMGLRHLHAKTKVGSPRLPCTDER